MEEAEWDIDRHQWALMSRCNKCAYQIFNRYDKTSEAWAVMAYRKALSGGPSPEALRDQRLGGKNNPNYRKITKVLYY